RLAPSPQATSSPTAPNATTTPGTTTTDQTTTMPGAATPPETMAGSLFLQAGGEIRVAGRGAFTFPYEGNRYEAARGQIRLECHSLALGPRRHARPVDVLAVTLRAGRVRVRSGRDARRALVLSPEMLARAAVRGTSFIVDRSPASRRTRAHTLNGLIVVARA